VPNLLPYIDSSELYNQDITNYYTFIDCKISTPHFKMKYATGDYNGEISYFYLLTDNSENHLAIIRLVGRNINGRIYHQISKSYSLIQQKGYGEVLYENCLKFHSESIISDNLNTLPGSFNLWKKIINKNSIDVYRFDTFNKRQSKIRLPIDDFLIWGVDESFLEAIQSTPWDSVTFNEFSEEIDDDSDNAVFVDYLTESDVIERTILSDFIVKALQNKRKIKNRSAILLLIKK
jgi:hypothetical protein